MLKGKRLYKRTREFVEEELPRLDTVEGSQEKEIEQEFFLLGVALAVDIAESLRLVANKD